MSSVIVLMVGLSVKYYISPRASCTRQAKDHCASQATPEGCAKFVNVGADLLDRVLPQHTNTFCSQVNSFHLSEYASKVCKSAGCLQALTGA